MIERNKYGRAIVKSEVGGYEGSAEVCWIENDGYNEPHWGAFVLVPFKDAKWHKFFTKMTEAEAIDKAKEVLEYSLRNCTMI